MPIYPEAVVKLLPQNATQVRITPRKIVHHTAVDGTSTKSLFDWFKSPSAKGAESHFYVRADGTVEQYMDTNVRADAQFAANVDAISIETWDGRATTNGPANPWTEAQVQALIRLDRWLCDTHKIPPVQCPSPTGAGIGWHSLFRDWNTDSHACPGQPRIDQIVNRIIPALTSQEDIVTDDDINKIAAAVATRLSGDDAFLSAVAKKAGEAVGGLLKAQGLPQFSGFINLGDVINSVNAAKSGSGLDPVAFARTLSKELSAVFAKGAT